MAERCRFGVEGNVRGLRITRHERVVRYLGRMHDDGAAFDIPLYVARNSSD